jgi:hypothetical protein
LRGLLVRCYVKVHDLPGALSALLFADLFPMHLSYMPDYAVDLSKRRAIDGTGGNDGDVDSSKRKFFGKKGKIFCRKIFFFDVFL